MENEGLTAAELPSSVVWHMECTWLGRGDESTMRHLFGLIGTGVLMTGLALAQSTGGGTGVAGGTGTPGTTLSGTDATTSRHTERDNDFNLGWLGLLGLAGLLRRPKAVVHHDHHVDTNRMNTPRV